MIACDFARRAVLHKPEQGGRLLAAVAVILVGGCAGLSSDASGTCDGPLWQETQLFLGRDSPSGEVTEAQWQKFLDEVVAPRFKDGFTVLDADGFYLPEGAAEAEGEKSKILIVLYPDRDGGGRALQEIATAYVDRFAQQAALRADRPVCVDFVTGSDEPD